MGLEWLATPQFFRFFGLAVLVLRFFIGTPGTLLFSTGHFWLLNIFKCSPAYFPEMLPSELATVHCFDALRLLTDRLTFSVQRS